MSAIVIKADKKSNKILSQLAIQLGGNVIILDDTQAEEIMFAKMMDNVKTGKTASKKSVLSKLRSK